MLIKNSESHFGQVARVLHWSSVGLLLTVVYISSQFDSLDEGAERSRLIALHVSYGLILLAVMGCRFGWRQINLNPLHSYTIARWQRRSAISVHWMIYAAVGLQCVLGIAQVLTAGEGLRVLGIQLLPAFYQENIELHGGLNNVHMTLANLIYLVLAIHITAAIYHQIFGVLELEDSE